MPKPKARSSRPSISPALAEAAAELVERTCRAQGLPEQVSDPAALAKVAAVMRASADATPQRRAG